MPIIKRLADGATFEGTPDQVEALVRSGEGELAGPTRVFNPKDSTLYEGDPQHATAAIRAGGSIEGSHSHQVASTGYGESAARGVAQGVTMGFADEIQAGIRSLGSDKTYEQLRDDYRAGDSIAHEANPKTFTGSEIGGSVAGAFIPGLGAAGAVTKGAGIAAKVGKTAAIGGLLGGVSGAGHSEGATAGEVLTDAAKEAALGAGLGVGGHAVGAGLQGAAGAAFDPIIQRFKAFGGKTRDLMGPQGKKVVQAMHTVDEMGLLDAKKGNLGVPPTQQTLLNDMELVRADTADQLVKKFAQAEGMELSLNDVIPPSEIAFLENKVNTSDPQYTATVQNIYEDLMKRVEGTQGDIGKLWQLKKDTGKWVSDAWKTPQNRINAKEEIVMHVNRLLEDALSNATDNIATIGKDTSMRELNKQYGALTTLLDVANKANFEDIAASKTLGGFRFTSGISGGATGALGMAVAGPPGAVIGGVGGALLDRGMKSTPGRLMRAKVGEELGVRSRLGKMLHADQQQQAVAMGAVPRTVDGIKKWISDHADMVPPQIRQQVESTLALGGVQVVH